MVSTSNLTQLKDISGPAALAIGTFDGVHVGHQAVIGQCVRIAREQKGQAWVVTFHPHPLTVLAPERAPDLITSPQQKNALLADLGIDGCVTLPFTKTLALQSPEEFVQHICEQVPTLCHIVVGNNWTFGHKASGDTSLLLSLGTRYGFDVTLVEAASWGGERISSTRIRQAIQAGHLEDVTEMLSRHATIVGVVGHGRKIGRKIGCPTANMERAYGVQPPDGVYAVVASVEGQSFAGAAYVGRTPTFHKGPPNRLLEVHLLDVELDLYGKTVEISLVKSIRGDLRFESEEALREQISADIDAVREALSQLSTLSPRS